MLRRFFLIWALVALLVTISAPAGAQVLFANVTSARGITPSPMPHGMTAGLAAADYDDDGDVDVFLPTASGSANRLYRNLGNGTFEEIAASVGLASPFRYRGALWFDYDGDGRLDLLVTSDCFDIECGTGRSLLQLYRQTEIGSFVEVTTEVGLSEPDLNHNLRQHRGGSVVGDLNNDGYLDLVVGMWVAGARVFLNQGGTSFVDVTASCGLEGAFVGHWQPLLHDFTGDGWMDLFWAIDFYPNQLWIHQGLGAQGPTFVNQAVQAGVANAWNEMGATVGDYDNDGDGDIYVTNIYTFWEGSQRHNVLYRNDSVGGVPKFAEISKNMGVDNGGWGWGTTFFDADNDGWLDLAETNGTFLPDEVYKVSMRLYMSSGSNPVQFTDVAASAGLEDKRWGSGLVAFDFDRDGDLDLMQTVQDSGAVLYENQYSSFNTGHHYLVIRPRMAGPNSRAIGAQVVLEAGGVTQRRWITAGTSMGSQEPAEAFFGLAESTSADRVVIHWPDGRISQLTGVSADQVLTVGNSGIFTDGFESGNLSAWTVP